MSPDFQMQPVLLPMSHFFWEPPGTSWSLGSGAMGPFAAVCSLLVEAGRDAFHSEVSLSLSPANDKAETERDPEPFLTRGLRESAYGTLMSVFILLLR